MITPYSQHYRCSFQLFEGKKTGILFQELFDQFLYNYRVHKTTGGIPLSMQHLADATGIHRHSIKSALETLEKSGAITLENGMCYINADYYISVVSLYSFAKKEQRELIKKAFKNHDIEELVKLGYIKKKLEDECIELAKGDMNVQNCTQMSKTGHECTKLDTNVQNWTSDNNESCPKLDTNVQNWTLMAETLWSDLSKMGDLEENYQPNLPYNIQDLESKMSVYVEMAKTGQFSTAPTGFMDVLMGIGGIVVARTMAKTGHCYGQNWTFDVQNCTFSCPKLDTLNIKEKNKEKIKYERSEYIEGENKEKVEVEEELEDNEELPVDLNNFYGSSFLENSLGKSSSNNQGTSSDENNLDSEPLMETSQEEEINTPESPDCEKYRNVNYPVYSQVEIERILDERSQLDSEIELAIRDIWNELTQVEEDEDPVEIVPVNQFGKNLQNYIEDKTAADPEFPVTLNDLFNAFAFEYFWEDNMWFYKLSSSSIRNINGRVRKKQEGEETSSQEYEAARNSRRSNDSVSRDCYFEAVREVGDEDDTKLSDMELILYRLFQLIDTKDLSAVLMDGRMVDGRVICRADSFLEHFAKWSCEASMGDGEADWMHKKFKRENRMMTLQPSTIKYRKILEWNHNNDDRNSAELLWKQKMAESGD